MRKFNAGLISLVAVTAMLALSAPAIAGGGSGHHGGGGRHGFGHGGYGGGFGHGGYGFGYSHGYGYGGHYYNRHYGYGYLGAGLLLGAAYADYAYQPRYVERRTVVYRTPVYSQSTVNTLAPQPQSRGAPVPAERPDYYLRKDRNGECWLVENTEDGEQIITPQSPDECG